MYFRHFQLLSVNHRQRIIHHRTDIKSLAISAEFGAMSTIAYPDFFDYPFFSSGQQPQATKNHNKECMRIHRPWKFACDGSCHPTQCATIPFRLKYQ